MHRSNDKKQSYTPMLKNPALKIMLMRRNAQWKRAFVEKVINPQRKASNVTNINEAAG